MENLKRQICKRNFSIEDFSREGNFSGDHNSGIQSLLSTKTVKNQPCPVSGAGSLQQFWELCRVMFDLKPRKVSNQIEWMDRRGYSWCNKKTIVKQWRWNLTALTAVGVGTIEKEMVKNWIVLGLKRWGEGQRNRLHFSSRRFLSSRLGVEKRWTG